jgi:two-component system, NtrC family, sensor kinase
MAKRQSMAHKATKKRKAAAPRRSKTATAGVKQETARLRRELTDALERQRATGEILAAISRSSFDLQSVLDTLVQSAARLSEAAYCFIFRRDGNKYRLAASHGFSIEYREWMKLQAIEPSRHTLVGRTALEGRTIHIPDILADPEYTWRESIQRGGFRAMLGIPLLREGQPIGVIAACRPTADPFTAKQIELVSTFADQAVIAIENARLFDEVKAKTEDLAESLQQQTATADVLKVISSSKFDLQPILDTLVETAARLCETDYAFIFKRDGDVYRLAANHGFSAEYEQWIRENPPAMTRGSTTGRTAIDRKIVHIHDVLADPGYQAAAHQSRGGYRTVLGVPLLRGEEVVGVFTLAHLVVKPFTEKQIELVTTFADQAVIAIENVRLFEEVTARTEDLRESLQQQTATADVLKVISRSTFDLQTVLNTLLESAARLCDADLANIWRPTGGPGFHLAAGVAGKNEWLENKNYLQQVNLEPGRGSIVGRTLLEGKAVQIRDIQVDPEYELSELIRIGDYRSMLGVPLLREGTTVGVFVLTRCKVKPFTNKEIELVTTFADQAVIAIENVRLFDEVNARTEDLRESLQQQTATADVLKVISRSTFDLQTVLDTLTESAARLCGADMATVARQDDAGFFYNVTNHNFPDDWIEYSKSFRMQPDRGGVVGRALLAGGPVQIADVLADPEYTYYEQQKRAGFRALLATPLLRGGQPIGVFLLARKTVQPFDDKQMTLVSTFADQAVIAIENVRLFDEVKARTRDLAESLQQQTATADVLKVISRSAFDLQAVLHTLVESAARLCDADKATITRQRDGAFYRAESFGFSSEFMNHVKDIPVTPDRGSVTGRALLEGVVIHVPDVHTDPDYHFDEALRLGKYRTLLGVPMMREGLPIGVIALTRSEPRPFTDKQIELATTFADQAAIAIENVRLFESVEARTRELAKSLEELRAAQDRLIQTEKLASLGQLTAGIAHEIKNPLNFVNNFSALSLELIDELGDVLKPAPLDARTREESDELARTLKGNLEKVVQHGKRADSIVKNMLLHSREGSVDRRAVDINALVGESLNLAYHGARAEGRDFQIRLDQDFDPAAGEAEVLPQEITRVMLNLISNGFYAAMKRKAEAGSNGYEPMLVAATRNLGDRVEICIRDNGGGIQPDVRAKMFNPFFTTKPPGEGTGLGLSLSHDIVVKQHGGSIEVDTQPGEFTEFRVVLPRAAASGR